MSATRPHSARPPPGGASSFTFSGNGTCVNDGAVQSANRFASGANQNTGNVMTGRSSTRINAPPGGHSSIVFNDETTSPKASNRFRKPSYLPPAAGESLHVMKGQIPIGGKTTVEVGGVTGQPTPIAQRGSVGGHQHHVFNDSPPSAAEQKVLMGSNNERVPVGGNSLITLGTMGKSPVADRELQDARFKSYGVFRKSADGINGPSAAAAGGRVYGAGFDRGQTTLTQPLDGGEARSSHRVPPGGAPSMMLNFDEKDGDDRAAIDKHLNSDNRPPPGGPGQNPNGPGTYFNAQELKRRGRYSTDVGLRTNEGSIYDKEGKVFDNLTKGKYTAMGAGLETKMGSGAAEAMGGAPGSSSRGAGVTNEELRERDRVFSRGQTPTDGWQPESVRDAYKVTGAGAQKQDIFCPPGFSRQHEAMRNDKPPPGGRSTITFG